MSKLWRGVAATGLAAASVFGGGDSVLAADGKSGNKPGNGQAAGEVVVAIPEQLQPTTSDRQTFNDIFRNINLALDELDPSYFDNAIAADQAVGIEPVDTGLGAIYLNTISEIENIRQTEDPEYKEKAKVKLLLVNSAADDAEAYVLAKLIVKEKGTYLDRRRSYYMVYGAVKLVDANGEPKLGLLTFQEPLDKVIGKAYMANPESFENFVPFFEATAS